MTVKHLTLALITFCLGCLVFHQADVSAEPANAKIESRSAADVEAATVSDRFADSETKEIPDFQKHVIPLLGRLGCNGRACHGSFQGRGGFQLSLFGYDFKTDHDALMDEASGRVDVDDIDESLILVKPTDAEMHEGGKRYELGSWQHHVLRRWIESGAAYEAKRAQKLVQLEVTPSEIQFDGSDQSESLRAIAHWQDGTREDVTELCRFSTNDDGVATIDQHGQVRSGLRGDTHVVVYYDNAVVPVPVMRPIGSGSDRPDFDPEHPIDKFVQEKLDKLGITPSGTCTDAEFIRRASLDITGILPSGAAVREFLSDESPDKRRRLIDDLLASPGYAAWWATRFSDWTGNSDEQLINVLPIRGVATKLWYEWLRFRLEENVPYDEIIEGIVTAESRQSEESYREFCETMTKACQPGNENMFAQRDGLPMFWGRRNYQKPEERAIGFAYTFLGVRIECAQCHKHPFDQWSKSDFEQFAQLFTPIRVNANQVKPDAKEQRAALLAEITGGEKLRGGELRRAISKAGQEGKIIPFGELLVNTQGLTPKAKAARQKAKEAGRDLPPAKIPTGKILGQEQPITLDQDPRPALMQWLRSPDNPYFAKAIVNRVWSNYFGSGIVDPTDDMNLANPPVNAPLLDYLAAEFVRNEFDLRWLHRTITTSEAYQRSAQTNETNVDDRTNFSHHIPRRLPAEVVYDAIVLATGSDLHASKLRGELTQMAIADGKPRKRNQNDFALEVFGQSIRETNCDCDRSDAPSLLQSIYLRNDDEMHQRLTAQDGWVAQACRALGVEGPNSAVDPKKAAATRRAQGIRRQLVNRVRRFQDQPKERQSRMQPQLKREYKRVSERLTQLDFQVPPLSELLANVNSWKDLEPIKQVASKPMTVESLVDDAYLRTLSRYPDDEESKISVDYIKQSKSPAEGVESLLWALVNTKEFIITH